MYVCNTVRYDAEILASVQNLTGRLIEGFVYHKDNIKKLNKRTKIILYGK